MQIFYDPANGQVMAIYTFPYTGSVWQKRGFLPAETDIPLTRDYRVTVEDGLVVAAEPHENAEQPEQTPDELRVIAERDLMGTLLEQRARDPDAPQSVKDYAEARR